MVDLAVEEFQKQAEQLKKYAGKGTQESEGKMDKVLKRVRDKELYKYFPKKKRQESKSMKLINTE